MVFSSIPVYLDPPDWPQQQPNLEPGGGGVFTSNDAPQLPQPVPNPPGVPGSIRPGSMSDRARMAKIPMPEPGLKCPRCESTNTKFCYFNNYNLSQPRHFCKTCRRYWTRGGALRNVPVGGGCRRNKRSKSSNKSKSAAAAANGAPSSSTTSGGCGGTSTSTTASADVIIGHSLPPHGSVQLFPFLPPLHNLNDYVPSNLGLNNFETHRKIGGIDMEFQIGNTTGGGGAVMPNGMADQQWVRLQQFPFFGNSHVQDTSPQLGFYPLEGVQGTGDHQLLSKPSDSTVKMEDINQGLNPSRNFSGISGSGQYWQGNGTDTNAWGSDLSHGFSSSASHLL